VAHLLWLKADAENGQTQAPALLFRKKPPNRRSSTMTRRFFPLLCLTLLLAACQKSQHTASGTEPLKIGMELTYPPFEMQNDAGQPDGVGVEIAKALAVDLGRPLKIVPMEFSGLIPALKTGSIDLVISSMTATDERRKSIDFSDPYAFTGLAILTAKGSSIQSQADLKKPGVRIAVKSTTTAESWVDANAPLAKKTAYPDEAACVMEVAQHRSDAFIYDQLSIYRYQKQNADTTTALLKPFQEESWAIGIAKGQDDLKGKVNAFLARFRAEGKLTALADRYLADEKKLLDSMGIPFILR
jgi:polar amino acid transport system substrate-binding protein